jgi:uncharacterized protein
MLNGTSSLRMLSSMMAVSVIVIGGAAIVMGADAASRKEAEEWRKKHEADYRREYVPLAGLFDLKQGANKAGSAPGNDIRLPGRTPKSLGRFVLQGKNVRLELDEQAVPVTIKGKRVTGSVLLRSDETDDPDELVIHEGTLTANGQLSYSPEGGVALWVHISGERPTIRMRDPKGEPARTFRGFQWFPIEDKYRVTGRFIKDAAPREVRAPNQLGDEDVMQSEGVVEFTIEGQKVRLRPMTTRPKRFWFIFRDGTSGKETYETARFLYSDLKDDGTTVLDFNQAYNPPCAFNPYTTCPIPLPENRLKVRILAGEKAYAQK